MAKKTLQASAEARAAIEENRVLARDLPKLRELGQARDILEEWFNEAEGEETPELAMLWAELQGDTEQKVLNWGHYLHNREAVADLMQADEQFYAAEAQRLKDRRTAYEAKTERSRAALQFQMEEQAIDRAEDEYITVALQRNPPSLVGDVPVEVLQTWFISDDPTLVSFVSYKPEQFALNRANVKAAAKNLMIQKLPDGLEIVAPQRVVIK